MDNNKKVKDIIEIAYKIKTNQEAYLKIINALYERHLTSSEIWKATDMKHHASVQGFNRILIRLGAVKKIKMGDDTRYMLLDNAEYALDLLKEEEKHENIIEVMRELTKKQTEKNRKAIEVIVKSLSKGAKRGSEIWWKAQEMKLNIEHVCIANKLRKLEDINFVNAKSKRHKKTYKLHPNYNIAHTIINKLSKKIQKDGHQSKQE